jgi:hypothetical protein
MPGETVFITSEHAEVAETGNLNAEYAERKKILS